IRGLRGRLRRNAGDGNKKARLGERAWGKEETYIGFIPYLFFFFAFFAAIFFPSFAEALASVSTTTICGCTLHYHNM
ncbi:MAG: hypothetical protein ABSA59_21200, partial [Terriglobia bacterium]